MRATTTFQRLLDLFGVTVTDVEFRAPKATVTVKLRSKRLHCPECSFTTKIRYDTRSVSSSWRHLDLECCYLEVQANLRRISCLPHGVRTEGVLLPGRGPVSPVTSKTWLAASPRWTRAPYADWCASTGTVSDGSSSG